MLTAHLHPDVLIVVSEISDGSMKLGAPPQTGVQWAAQREVVRARRRLLRAADLDPALAVRVHVTYDTADFCRYRAVGSDERSRGIGRDDGQDATTASDALATDQPGVGLLLPVADCMPVVAYDHVRRVVALTHLGRHSVEQRGGARTIAWMAEHFGSRPGDVSAWLGPAPSGSSYPLHRCGGRSFDDEVTRQLTAAGVPPQQLVHSAIDTATDRRFFSHSEFLAGRRPVDGRYAVVAALRA
ncbi:polyphenol oxidase family protein [Pseudoclavibacter soli]|uniref:polyphenol oxidase family protein n=1 Tax=Pseudoclavibacter soli TaxID=452623 RepID=UPI0004162727|nr:polyphenol oxidase family protein [Pseudoclavibacter soli]